VMELDITNEEMVRELLDTDLFTSQLNIKSLNDHCGLASLCSHCSKIIIDCLGLYKYQQRHSLRKQYGSITSRTIVNTVTVKPLLPNTGVSKML
jgi:hypothetical protein